MEKLASSLPTILRPHTNDTVLRDLVYHSHRDTHTTIVHATGSGSSRYFLLRVRLPTSEQNPNLVYLLSEISQKQSKAA
jgi:hypothetical protein